MPSVHFFMGKGKCYLEKKKGTKVLKSIWESDADLERRKALPGNVQTENVVIGAGMAGLLIAYFLQKQGKQVLVVEAKTIGSGQTKGTTAKITSQHGLCYAKMIRNIGRKKAKQYAEANEQAIRLYERMIYGEHIDCEFERKAAYLYTVRKHSVATLQKEAEAAMSLGIKAQFVTGTEWKEFPFEAKAGVCFENQAQFHPLKFISHLAKELTIYENTKVLSVKKHEVITNRGIISADNIVFATHYPILNVPGFYFLRQHQERSYVLALQAEKESAGMYYGIDEGGLSLRSVGNVLLLGGGGHRTGKKNCGCSQSSGYGYLRKMAQLYYPGAKELAAWSAQDSMPHDEVPFIGRYSMLRPYWYVATGFGKWGMTASMIAARIISSQISGISEEDSKVFSPWRFRPRAAFAKLAVDVGESIVGLAKGWLGSRKKRCPHMGCRLEWNGWEDSYDCPCHGSRFDEKGELLDNPAQTDKR